MKNERIIPQQATYTAKEAAAYLKVSERQIPNFIARKLLRKKQGAVKDAHPRRGRGNPPRQDELNRGSSHLPERLAPGHRLFRRCDLGELRPFVAFRIAAENFGVGRHNQLSAVAMSLPLRDHLHIHTLLPKTLDASHANCAE